MDSFRTPWALLPGAATATALMLVLAGPARADGDATLDQVYRTAQAGHLDQAEQLMQTVLRDHPNSAKAHYVDAELLARDAQSAQARSELATAERLAPGLPFAAPEAVRKLRHELAVQTGAAPYRSEMAFTNAPALPASPANPLSWNLMLAVTGGAFLAWLLMRLLRPAAAPVAPSSPAFAAPAPHQAWSTPWSGGAPAAAPAAGGFGSQVASGLTTGLAVGAGVMAAEAIGHRLFGNESSSSSLAAPGWMDRGRETLFNRDVDAGNADMGGRDFGIADGSSWDDAGSSAGGSDDWS